LRKLTQNLPSEAKSKFCDNSNVRLKQLLDFFFLLTTLFLHIYSFLFFLILALFCSLQKKSFLSLYILFILMEYFSLSEKHSSIFLLWNNLFFLTNKSLLYLSLRNQLFSFWQICKLTYSSSWKNIFSSWQFNSFLILLLVKSLLHLTNQFFLILS